MSAASGLSGLSGVSAVQRRAWAEDLVRRRRADDLRRTIASQRAGRIDANPHQLDAVLFALRRIPEGGCILADEVGLGKTIEAGLVIAQLRSEGTAKRVLLITPKPLIGQWREELHQLFGMAVKEARTGEAFEGDGIFIVGREAAGTADVGSALRRGDTFDLCVIDEAHEVFASLYRRYDAAGVYRPDSKHAKTAGRVKELLEGTPTLLLTATPIQNSLAELWGLVQYVDPEGTLLGDLATFRAVFTDGDDRRLAVGSATELKERLEQVVQRTLRRHAQAFMRRPFVGRRARTYEYAMSAEEKSLYDDVSRYLLTTGAVAFSGTHRTLLLLGFHRRMASSKAALAASLRNVESRLERMMRAVAAGRTEEGEETAQVFADDFDGMVEALEREDVDDGEIDPRAVRNELTLVRTLRQRAEGLSRDGKMRALIEAVRSRLKQDTASKVVIFTESLTTQEYLHDTLIEAGVALPRDVTLFRGRNDGPRAAEAHRSWEATFSSAPDWERPTRQVAIRLALVHEFRTRSRVFISTEAGAKGLNLQFADTLINYDLPWNPQRIEQRIGRCHRYGQTRDVTVINFLARDNAAQRLTYEILSQKLELFGSVMGASDVVLHEAQGQARPILPTLSAHFEKEIGEIYRQARSMDEIERRLQALRDSTSERKQHFEAEHARTASLIESRLDESVQVTFRKLAERLPAELRALDEDIERVVRGYLDAIGITYRRMQRDDHVRYQLEPHVALPPRLREGGAIAIGEPASDTEPIHVGHALVLDALAESRAATESIDTVKVETGSRPKADAEGRLLLVRVRHGGLEPVDRIHTLAFVKRDGVLVGLHPIETEDLLDRIGPATRELDVAPETPPVLEDALDTLVFTDQHELGETTRALFSRRMRRLDRFIEDRALVLRRESHVISSRIREAEHERDRAMGGGTRSKAEAKLRRATQRLEEVEVRLTQLQTRQDDTYLEHRDLLFDRYYVAPEVDVLVDVRWVAE